MIERDFGKVLDCWQVGNERCWMIRWFLVADLYVHFKSWLKEMMHFWINCRLRDIQRFLTVFSPKRFFKIYAFDNKYLKPSLMNVFHFWIICWIRQILAFLTQFNTFFLRFMAINIFYQNLYFLNQIYSSYFNEYR